MYLTPLGVFSLMGKAVSNFGGEVLATSLTYILFAWGGCLAVLLVVMMLPLWLFARVTPLQYFRRMSRVLITALSTCSSAATLPETLRTCREEFGVPEKFTGLVAPLGCTIHMCGGAVSFCLLGLFTMQMAGQSVSLGSFVYMLLVAEIMNMAAPGSRGRHRSGGGLSGHYRGAAEHHGHVQRHIPGAGYGVYHPERSRRRNGQRAPV